MGLLASLQSAIADRLRAEELVSRPPSIDIVEEDRGDLDAAIARAVGRTGIVVTIETPGLRSTDDNRRAMEASILIEVQENVPVNRGPAGSQRTWLTLSEKIMALLIDWPPPGGWTPLEFGSVARQGPGTPVVTQITFTSKCIVTVSDQ